MSGTDAVRVAPSNTQQLRAWDGDEGAYWATHADHYDRAVTEHHQALLAAAAVSAHNNVLDIGCGTGQTTRDAARAASDGSALGIDLSSRMLDHARRQAAAEHVTNVVFEQADAQIHPFKSSVFDLAISRTGAMFFGDMGAAFANIAQALRPGGRIVLLSWQPLEHNEWMQEISGALAAGRDLPTPPPSAPGPFALSEPDRVRTILSRAGFSAIELDGISAGMWFGADADSAHRFALGQLGWMLEGLDDAGRARASGALYTTMQAHQSPAGVVFGSSAWIITAIASTK